MFPNMRTRLLVLGGTGFVGPAVIGDARARGWDVTVLNRGTRPTPGGVTALRGDRTAPGGLTVLDGGQWDVAVDTWSAAPTVVRDTAAHLVDEVGRYVYVSSRSVYRQPMPAGADERFPVVHASTRPPTTATSITPGRRRVARRRSSRRSATGRCWRGRG
jgi:2'-hydroxyisoflavone reductase